MRFVNGLKTTLLLGTLMGLCLAVGYFVGGRTGLLYGLIFGGVGNWVAFFFSDKIALAAMGAQPVQRSEVPWLFEMVERLTERDGLPMPRICVSPQAAPNAFATGRNPQHAAVAVTAGMLRNFPRDEIEGVLAHELSHVKHRDVLISTVAATLAGIISYAGFALMFMGGGSDRRDNPLGAVGAIAMIILAPIAAAFIQMGISRSREYAADASGGRLCGDPLKLARALRRLEAINEHVPMDVNPAFAALCIVEPLSAGAVAKSLMSTHPPIEKRIAALERLAQEMR